MKKEILNSKKTRLRLFESGIKMDESLPKHKEYNEYVAKKKLLDEARRKGMSLEEMAQADLDLYEMEVQAMNINSLPPILSSNGVGMDDTIIPRKGIPDYEKLKKMFLEDTGLDSCKVTVTSYMKDIMEKNRWSFGNTITPASDQSIIIEGGKKDSFWDRLKKLVHPDEHPTPEPIIEFDVVSFFNRVKLETEDSQQSYTNTFDDFFESIGI